MNCTLAKQNKVNTTHRILKVFYAYKRNIIILFLFGLVNSIFYLVGPLISKLFIDKAFLTKDIDTFLDISVVGVIVFLFSMFVGVMRDVIKNRISIKIRLNIADKYIKKLFSLDLEYFRSKSIGENIFRLSDTETLCNIILEQCPSFLIDVCKISIILVISLWIDLRMTIFFLIVCPLFIIPNIYLQNKLKPLYEEVWKHGAQLAHIIHEGFSKMLIVKAFGLESFQRRTYTKHLIKNIRWGIKSFRWSIINSVGSSILSKAIFGGVAFYGGMLIIDNKISIGSYTAVMLYLTQLGCLFKAMGDRFGYLIQEAVSFDKLFEVMDIEPQIKDSAGAKTLKSIHRDISFKNVSFGYQKDRPIFNELNLDVPGCSWVALVGPSGSGKTTLMNLLIRLYEPWAGEVLLDGLNLKDITLTSLRKRITIATQEPFLFDVSICENITYGLKGMSRKEIEAASSIASVHDYISQLPDGYDSFIGEDACRLSQGLKQRIALARAIVRAPDLLILDEATSAVDLHTEEKIFRALRDKRQGLNTIIISHRLFSVKDAERIYFLNQGKIEVGTHAQLLSGSQVYRDFFRNQMEEQLSKNG
ncbi:MAG: ABC transporter ATP-binding protein [Candidatus Omnitrophica bacterium]|nr:ABC transporter ATP-binding protein [Candidatus Omnitrophota bacterium]